MQGKTRGCWHTGPGAGSRSVWLREQLLSHRLRLLLLLRLFFQISVLASSSVAASADNLCLT